MTSQTQPDVDKENVRVKLEADAHKMASQTQYEAIKTSSQGKPKAKTNDVASLAKPVTKVVDESQA